MKIIRSARPAFWEDVADKVYKVVLVESNGLPVRAHLPVDYRYGRRGSTLREVPLAAWRSALEPAPPAPEPILPTRQAVSRPEASSPALRISAREVPAGGVSPIGKECRGDERSSGLWNSRPARPPGSVKFEQAMLRILVTLLKVFGILLLLSLTLGSFPPLGMLLLIGLTAYPLHRLLKRL